MNQMNVCIHDVSFGSALIAGIDRTTSDSQIGQHERAAIGRRLWNRISFHTRDRHQYVGQIFVPASGAADEGEHENVAAHGPLDGDRLIQSNAA
ncbi:hypothetical protein [Burkholderia ambifaria]|uniref:hypothetical protein n=1 Tax=Burkholderia ambifaria TaxID=152480 RepID=UPI003398B4FB